MENIIMKTGQLLKQLRLKKGLTQEELAARTNISVRTIQRIEKGEVEARAYTLQTLAKVLDVDFEEIINKGTITPEDSNSNSNSIWLPLLHLSGLFTLLLPPVIIWIWKRDHIKDIREHGIDVINFQINILIFLIPSAILAGLLITIPIVIFLGVFSTVIIIINTIKVLNGQTYKYPLKIRILKP